MRKGTCINDKAQMIPDKFINGPNSYGNPTGISDANRQIRPPQHMGEPLMVKLPSTSMFTGNDNRQMMAKDIRWDPRGPIPRPPKCPLIGSPVTDRSGVPVNIYAEPRLTPTALVVTGRGDEVTGTQYEYKCEIKRVY